MTKDGTTSSGAPIAHECRCEVCGEVLPSPSPPSDVPDGLTALEASWWSDCTGAGIAPVEAVMVNELLTTISKERKMVQENAKRFDDLMYALTCVPSEGVEAGVARAHDLVNRAEQLQAVQETAQKAIRQMNEAEARNAVLHELIEHYENHTDTIIAKLFVRNGKKRGVDRDGDSAKIEALLPEATWVQRAAIAHYLEQEEKDDRTWEANEKASDPRADVPKPRTVEAALAQAHRDIEDAGEKIASLEKAISSYEEKAISSYEDRQRRDVEELRGLLGFKDGDGPHTLHALFADVVARTKDGQWHCTPKSYSIGGKNFTADELLEEVIRLRAELGVL